MNKNGTKFAGRDSDPQGLADEPTPESSSGRDTGFATAPIIPPKPIQEADSMRPAGAETSPPEPEDATTGPADAPFDMEALIRSKQERIEPRPNTDPFDPTLLRLSPDYGASIGVRRLVTTVPVRKPSKEAFVRTHPDEAYRLSTWVLELKEDQETYLIVPALWDELSSEATVSPRLLLTTVNRAGVLTLWPIRLPGPDGKVDNWSRSAMEAADVARTRWVRVSASMSLGGYEVAVATGTLPEPAWPDLKFGEILRIAFKDRMIDSMDHPVLRRLRGEI